MKKLIALFSAACLVLLLGISESQAAVTWGDNFKKAQAQAKAEKKLLLLDFTGSDWCPWCVRLNQEVFSKPQFKDYAAKNLVLMEVDFPQAKPQSGAVKAQNAQLQSKYQVEGYPTVIVLNSAGKKVGELGYQPGGPAAFIAELKKLQK